MAGNILNMDGELCFNTITIANYISKFCITSAQTLTDKVTESSEEFNCNSDLFRKHYVNKGVTPDAKFPIKPVSARDVSFQPAALDSVKALTVTICLPIS